MPGREPMNPRGRQFGLGGTLTSWVRREAFPPAEAAVLRRCYRGREPRAFSRYGLRQWAAPFNSTRLIIKDPFAILSLHAVHEVTGALPVLLYRHPAAVLASYRRMGWTADTEEMTALGAPAPSGAGDLESMVSMWLWCHQIALADLDDVPDAVIVSHHALTVGSDQAHAALCRELGLEFSPAVAAQPPAAPSSERREGVLHDFDRSPTSVDTGWRGQLSADEIEHIEEAVAAVWTELESRQLTFPVPHHGMKDDPT
jgi:hypothetical protein